MPAERQCNLNEQYTTCGTSCEPQCADMHSKDGGPKMCNMMCRIGCECKKGYVRDKNNLCISERQCLANPCEGNPCRRDQVCVPQPNIRCFRAPCPQYSCENKPALPATRCPSGLPELKGYNCGRSFNRRDCPSSHYCEIHPADRYAVCCPDTENDACFNNPCARDEKCIPEPKNCFTTPCPQFRCARDDDHCPKFKCFANCPNGYAIDEETGCQSGCACAPPKLPCPLVRCSNQCKYGRKRDPITGCTGCQCNDGECSANEEFTTCGSCETTCKTLGTPIGCTTECREQCQCKKGYVRDEEWRCIRENRCPRRDEKCGSNEEFTECGSCETTCANLGQRLLCPAVCRVECQCKRGYVRDANNRCIRSRECPKTTNTKCKRGEELKRCGACDNTCANVLAGVSMACLANCRAPECGCRSGFVRNDKKICVRESSCKATSNNNPRTPRDCRLKPEAGMCEAYIPSFYYDFKSKSCKSFIYGGCGGNKNRFTTTRECIAKCAPGQNDDNEQDPCRQPKLVGMCRASIRSWFYNSQSGQCEKFYYGGCGGNKNRFRSVAACQRQCPPRRG